LCFFYFWIFVLGCRFEMYCVASRRVALLAALIAVVAVLALVAALLGVLAVVAALLGVLMA
jgi:hypothetical protein